MEVRSEGVEACLTLYLHRVPSFPPYEIVRSIEVDERYCDDTIIARGPLLGLFIQIMKPMLLRNMKHVFI
jgi:hypothetical protein